MRQFRSKTKLNALTDIEINTSASSFICQLVAMFYCSQCNTIPFCVFTTILSLAT